MEDNYMARRDEIIFGNVDRSRYGINGMGTRIFKHLPLVRLKRLLEEGFLNEDDRHNDSPTVAEFAAFMETHPAATVCGYTTSDEREAFGEDCVVSIYRIDLSTGDIKDLAEFVAKFKDADDFRCTWDDNAKVADCRAWWD